MSAELKKYLETLNDVNLQLVAENIKAMLEARGWEYDGKAWTLKV
jgi:hypothetical protein